MDTTENTQTATREVNVPVVTTYLPGHSRPELAQYAFAYTNLGSSWELKKDYAKAIKDYTQATQLDEEELHTFLDRALKVKTAKKIPPGTYTVVLGPTVTGLLAHA